MKTSLAAALVLLALSLGPSSVSAFDFEDLKTLERAEQEELLEKARQAARSWNFGAARSYLDQARHKGYAPKQVKAVEALIAKNESAKMEQERREQEAREAAAAAERQRAAASGGHGPSGSVIVEANCMENLCSTADLEVSGGPGYLSKGSHLWFIHPTGGRLAGRYNYSVRIGSRLCSGSFSVSGQRSRYTIRLYRDCSDANSGEL